MSTLFHAKYFDHELCEKFFLLRGAASSLKEVPEKIERSFSDKAEEIAGRFIEQSRRQDHGCFIEKCDKLDTWAEEMISAGESELFTIRWTVI